MKDDNTGQLERQIITDLTDPEIDAAKAYEAQWSALTKGQIDVTRIQFQSDRYVCIDGKPVHPTKETHAMAVVNELPRTTREEVFYALSFALRWRDAAQYACPSHHFDEADDLVQKLRKEYDQLP